LAEEACTFWRVIVVAMLRAASMFSGKMFVMEEIVLSEKSIESEN